MAAFCFSCNCPPWPSTNDSVDSWLQFGLSNLSGMFLLFLLCHQLKSQSSINDRSPGPHLAVAEVSAAMIVSKCSRYKLFWNVWISFVTLTSNQRPAPAWEAFIVMLFQPVLLCGLHASPLLLPQHPSSWRLRFPSWSRTEHSVVLIISACQTRWYSFLPVFLEMKFHHAWLSCSR